MRELKHVICCYGSTRPVRKTIDDLGSQVIMQHHPGNGMPFMPLGGYGGMGNEFAPLGFEAMSGKDDRMMNPVGAIGFRPPLTHEASTQSSEALLQDTASLSGQERQQSTSGRVATPIRDHLYRTSYDQNFGFDGQGSSFDDQNSIIGVKGQLNANDLNHVSNNPGASSQFLPNPGVVRGRPPSKLGFRTDGVAPDGSNQPNPGGISNNYYRYSQEENSSDV